MVLYDLKGGERKSAGPQGSEEAGVRAGERQRVLPGQVLQAASLAEEQSRTGHSSSVDKLGANLSRETSKRAGKYSSASLREGTRGANSHAASPSPALPPDPAQRCMTAAGTVA